jgi:hypothetical protein
LRVPEIEGFVVARPMMGGAERFRLGLGIERGAVLLHRVGRIKRVILSFGAFKQVELDEHSEKNLDDTHVGILRSVPQCLLRNSPTHSPLQSQPCPELP